MTATRTFTPDRTETKPDGRTTNVITMKRACNGCGHLIGDVTDAEVERAIAGLPALDVRDECPNCAPIVAQELAGCTTMQLTPENYRRIDAHLDRDDIFAKQYTALVDGKVTTVGMRIGIKPGHVVAYFGDWIIRHPDGGITVHKAPAKPETGEAA